MALDNYYYSKRISKLTKLLFDNLIRETEELRETQDLILEQIALLKSYHDKVDIPVIPEHEQVYGFGANTVGGLGGVLYVVTNLNDSGKGSLREAVEASGKRYVTFAVSGNIHLKTSLRIDNPFITIDGSTAPNGGICIKGNNVIPYASEILIKHVRLRLGDNGYKDANGNVIGSGSGDLDCVLFSGSGGKIENIVFQNCSISWSVDELIGFWANGIPGSMNNITIQRCVLSEPLYRSHHGDGAHSMSVLQNGAQNVTYYKNYFAHSAERNLRTQLEASFEMVNNVFYNVVRLGQYGASSKFDIINNHFKQGNTSFYNNNLIEPVSESGYKLSDSKVCISGNTNDGGKGEYKSDYNAIMQSKSVIDSTIIADENDAVMIANVLENAGATLPKRDAVDVRVINDYTNKTGNIIDTQEQVGGYPDLTK